MNELTDTPERVLMLVIPALETTAEHGADLTASRLWHEVLAAVKQVVPGAVALHTGCCVMRARGPARYYGSEANAAAAVLAAVAATCDAEVARCAIVAAASGSFAAQQAARAPETAAHVHSPSPGTRIVEPQHTQVFLAPLPVSRGTSSELTDTLIGLGIHTLGDFAALPEAAVTERFGRAALAPHRRARGLGEWHGDEVPAETPVSDLTNLCEFDFPLESADQLAFSCKASAEAFVSSARAQGLVCTELLVELLDDAETLHRRLWSHPTNFTAADVVNRIRWQAAALPTPTRGEQTSRAVGYTNHNFAHQDHRAGITAVRLTAASTARAAAHEPGLWSDAPDERVHDQLTRVQSIVGYEGVSTGALTGGRFSLARQRLVPWGHAAHPSPLSPPHAQPRSSSSQGEGHRSQPRAGPWPGHLPGSAPNLVFADLPPVELRDTQGAQVGIDADDMLSASPKTFHSPEAVVQDVAAWSAPWPIRERWWEVGSEVAHSKQSNNTTARGTVYRLQITLTNDDAWLLQYTLQGGWSAEGRYT